MAYTKYSLTPSSNTAAPPDGAPEGMLPSAVNDTMRDMMAQIRDCGDGIRDGTYTMTAPKITGGTITGSTINNSAIGGTTAAAGAFTTLSATGVTTVQAGTVSLPAITTTGDTNTGIYFPAADTIAFTEGGAEAMRIDSSGRVGIGTSSPSEKLQISGSGTQTFRITSTDGANADLSCDGTSSMSLGSPNGIPIRFVTNGSERMRIDSSGNVGIGSTSITAIGTGVPTLELKGTSGSFTARSGGIALITQDGTTNKSYIYADTDLYIQNTTATNTRFYTNNTERMRIDSSGNLLLQKTSATLSGAGTYFEVPSAPSTMPVYLHFCKTFSGTRDAIDFNHNGSRVGVIDFTNTATAYNTSSDYRLKENIAPMTGALATVQALNPVTYKWKVDGSDGQGFIAHELQAVVPDCVTGQKDAVDSEGNPQYQGIDTSFLVATLTAAIQELNAKVDAQALEIATLKAK